MKNNDKQLKLWYSAPAKQWVEALPLGNGRIGAMVFSDIKNDVIMLNEDTLWSGYPRALNRESSAEYYKQVQELAKQKKYHEAQAIVEKNMVGDYTEAYMPMGQINFRFDIDESKVSNYYRDLSLETAISGCSFDCDSVHYKREFFVSCPDQLMVIKLSADKKGKINFALNYESQLKYTTTYSGNTITLEGICPSHADPVYHQGDNPIVYEEDVAKKGISFGSIVQLDNVNGEVIAIENGVSVSNADEVIIKLAVRSSFNGYNKLPFLEGKEYKNACKNDITNAANYSYEQLKQRHIEDYQGLYNRVDFCLNEDVYYDIPTDERLKNFKTNQNDSGLYMLIFNFGRYLLIAGSRENTQATTLQGIWNSELLPPWSSNYTVNINTEMNYWPVEMCNLSELHNPLFELIKKISDTGEAVAKSYYNAEGFVCHHNTDIWGLANPVGRDSEGSAGYAYWQMGSGWLCEHLFEHYEYTLDVDFLKDTAYPLMKKSAKFYLDLLIKDENGKYMICSSTSPENRFVYEGKPCPISMVATMTMSIVKENFKNVIAASKILGIDLAFADELAEKLENLYPYQIGSKGQLLEWNEEYEEFEPHHRHNSHLYSLYPGQDITAFDTPELAKACKRTLELRGDDGTGWSLGWKINLWARLMDGEHSLKLLKNQLRFVKPDAEPEYVSGGGTYPNLFDAHPPFQIDGNFAAPAGIAQMFLQSYADRMYILPALPKEFANGHITGLCGKNGVLVSIWFENSKLSKAVIKATLKQPVTFDVIYNGECHKVTLTQNEEFVL